MTQGTIVIANGAGAAVRAAINTSNEATVTKQSGSSAPSPTYPFMDWADTTNDLLKQRNAANSAWIIKSTLSAEYGGLPAGSITYDPGSPNLLSANNVQDAIDELAARSGDYRGCVARKTGNQSISTSSTTALAFDAADSIDTDGIHDPSSNNERLTVPAGVTKIRLRAFIPWAAAANGFRQAFFVKNGATTLDAERVDPGNGSTGIYQTIVSEPLIVTSGDYFNVAVWQDSGGSVNVAGARAWFEMEIVE